MQLKDMHGNNREPESDLYSTEIQLKALCQSFQAGTLAVKIMRAVMKCRALVGNERKLSTSPQWRRFADDCTRCRAPKPMQQIHQNNTKYQSMLRRTSFCRYNSAIFRSVSLLKSNRGSVPSLIPAIFGTSICVAIDVQTRMSMSMQTTSGGHSARISDSARTGGYDRYSCKMHTLVNVINHIESSIELTS